MRYLPYGYDGGATLLGSTGNDHVIPNDCEGSQNEILDLRFNGNRKMKKSSSKRATPLQSITRPTYILKYGGRYLKIQSKPNAEVSTTRCDTGRAIISHWKRTMRIRLWLNSEKLVFQVFIGRALSAGAQQRDVLKWKLCHLSGCLFNRRHHHDMSCVRRSFLSLWMGPSIVYPVQILHN